ncbi:hypothetical protein KXD93_11965 [Mucilaginibacter sp. BJC16-A38]|uniref:hypothetical protein n=1 Tax=Mucilaginibacter phenanthrenivorans TaxID=1234842 RepID=UPI002157DA31|nr:hypothetical protein [Mucilaginibacter phenanthrenivorans]MCR8558365.1 hypothetical protein [Mucilaginibacter phenanthrenivorans]
MDLHELPYRLKSARQKRRLVKKDRDKQLIELDRLQTSLLEQKRQLPMIPLEHPYQKGWKRIFVLRQDVRQSEKAMFYQAILDKINTVEYNKDISFKKRKRRKQRYHYEEQPQTLRPIYDNDWQSDKLKFTEAEKECFYRNEEWSASRSKIIVTYLFNDSWRFVLAVKPHIIYEAKMVDEQLEQELKAIDNKIARYYLWPKITKINKGNCYKYWKIIPFEQPKYVNKLKNQPRYTNKEAYLD